MIPLIQINNLTIDFPEANSFEPALKQVSIKLFAGELLAIVGESGSGKSVMSLALMNLLSKAARVVNGSILFSEDGIHTTELLGLNEKNMRSLRGNKMAMIFQEPMTSLNPVRTCGSQVIEPLMQHKKLNRLQAKKEALSLFEKVQLSQADRIFNQYPHQLSGGQKQRVMIAMAISCRPALLICDEPTTALDVRVQKTILDLLKRLRLSEKIGIIFITHDLELVRDMADRVVVMHRGKMVEQGPVGEIFSNPENAYTRALLMCRPALHKKGERLPVVSDFLPENPKTNIELALNTASENSCSSKEKNEILLSVKNLHLRYSSGKNWLGSEKHWVDAIRDINFDVYRGETLGIVGESGSGKTTLGRALLGLNKPFQGSIVYDGTDLLRMRTQDMVFFRPQMQIVFQDPYSSLNPRMKIGPAIAEPLKVHDAQTPIGRNAYVMEWLEKVGLKPEHFYRYPHAFSGGQRQRVVIARALALRPDFVVFDESVSALDVSVQAQVLNLINDLKQTLGFTAIFISHDLSVIRYLCDRVIVMENGNIVESGNVESVYGNPQMPYTKSLLEAIPGKGPDIYQ
jgi:peptide/nickel transport system ATP-binding protein